MQGQLTSCLDEKASDDDSIDAENLYISLTHSPIKTESSERFSATLLLGQVACRIPSSYITKLASPLIIAVYIGTFRGKETPLLPSACARHGLGLLALRPQMITHSVGMPINPLVPGFQLGSSDGVSYNSRSEHNRRLKVFLDDSTVLLQFDGNIPTPVPLLPASRNNDPFAPFLKMQIYKAGALPAIIIPNRERQKQEVSVKVEADSVATITNKSYAYWPRLLYIGQYSMMVMGFTLNAYNMQGLGWCDWTLSNSDETAEHKKKPYHNNFVSQFLAEQNRNCDTFPSIDAPEKRPSNRVKFLAQGIGALYPLTLSRNDKSEGSLSYIGHFDLGARSGFGVEFDLSYKKNPEFASLDLACYGALSATCTGMKRIPEAISARRRGRLGVSNGCPCCSAARTTAPLHTYLPAIPPSALSYYPAANLSGGNNSNFSPYAVPSAIRFIGSFSSDRRSGSGFYFSYPSRDDPDPPAFMVSSSWQSDATESSPRGASGLPAGLSAVVRLLDSGYVLTGVWNDISRLSFSSIKLTFPPNVTSASYINAYNLFLDSGNFHREGPSLEGADESKECLSHFPSASLLKGLFSNPYILSAKCSQSTLFPRHIEGLWEPLFAYLDNALSTKSIDHELFDKTKTDNTLSSLVPYFAKAPSIVLSYQTFSFNIATARARLRSALFNVMCLPIFLNALTEFQHAWSHLIMFTSGSTQVLLGEPGLTDSQQGKADDSSTSNGISQAFYARHTIWGQIAPSSMSRVLAHASQPIYKKPPADSAQASSTQYARWYPKFPAEKSSDDCVLETPSSTSLLRAIDDLTSFVFSLRLRLMSVFAAWPSVGATSTTATTIEYEIKARLGDTPGSPDEETPTDPLPLIIGYELADYLEGSTFDQQELRLGACVRDILLPELSRHKERKEEKTNLMKRCKDAKEEKDHILPCSAPIPLDDTPMFGVALSPARYRSQYPHDLDLNSEILLLAWDYCSALCLPTLIRLGAQVPDVCEWAADIALTAQRLMHKVKPRKKRQSADTDDVLHSLPPNVRAIKYLELNYERILSHIADKAFSPKGTRSELKFYMDLFIKYFLLGDPETTFVSTGGGRLYNAPAHGIHSQLVYDSFDSKRTSTCGPLSLSRLLFVLKCLLRCVMNECRKAASKLLTRCGITLNYTSAEGASILRTTYTFHAQHVLLERQVLRQLFQGVFPLVLLRAFNGPDVIRQTRRAVSLLLVLDQIAKYGLGSADYVPHVVETSLQTSLSMGASARNQSLVRGFFSLDTMIDISVVSVFLEGIEVCRGRSEGTVEKWFLPVLPTPLLINTGIDDIHGEHYAFGLNASLHDITSTPIKYLAGKFSFFSQNEHSDTYTWSNLLSISHLLDVVSAGSRYNNGGYQRMPPLFRAINTSIATIKSIQASITKGRDSGMNSFKRRAPRLTDDNVTPLSPTIPAQQREMRQGIWFEQQRELLNQTAECLGDASSYTDLALQFLLAMPRKSSRLAAVGSTINSDLFQQVGDAVQPIDYKPTLKTTYALPQDVVFPQVFYPSVPFFANDFNLCGGASGTGLRANDLDSVSGLVSRALNSFSPDLSQTNTSFSVPTSKSFNRSDLSDNPESEGPGARVRSVAPCAAAPTLSSLIALTAGVPSGGAATDQILSWRLFSWFLSGVAVLPHPLYRQYGCPMVSSAALSNAMDTSAGAVVLSPTEEEEGRLREMCQPGKYTLKQCVKALCLSTLLPSFQTASMYLLSLQTSSRMLNRQRLVSFCKREAAPLTDVSFWAASIVSSIILSGLYGQHIGTRKSIFDSLLAAVESEEGEVEKNQYCPLRKNPVTCSTFSLRGAASVISSALSATSSAKMRMNPRSTKVYQLSSNGSFSVPLAMLGYYNATPATKGFGLQAPARTACQLYSIGRFLELLLGIRMIIDDDSAKSLGILGVLVRKISFPFLQRRRMDLFDSDSESDSTDDYIEPAGLAIPCIDLTSCRPFYNPLDQNPSPKPGYSPAVGDGEQLLVQTRSKSRSLIRSADCDDEKPSDADTLLERRDLSLSFDNTGEGSGPCLCRLALRTLARVWLSSLYIEERRRRFQH